MTELRQLREDDAEAVAALFAEAWGESRRMDGDEIREWLGNESLKPENRAEIEPNMPRTSMKETVIPKSGGTQTPETTPTTGVNK